MSLCQYEIWCKTFLSSSLLHSSVAQSNWNIACVLHIRRQRQYHSRLHSIKLYFDFKIRGVCLHTSLTQILRNPQPFSLALGKRAELAVTPRSLNFSRSNDTIIVSVVLQAFACCYYQTSGASLQNILILRTEGYSVLEPEVKDKCLLNPT